MTLKDLIMQTSFDKVSPEARKVYHVLEIRNLFERCECLQSIFVLAGSEEWYKSMLPEELHDKIKVRIE